MVSTGDATMAQYTAGVIVKQVKPPRRPRWHIYVPVILILLLLLLPLAYFAQSFSFSSSFASNRMASSTDVNLASSLNNFSLDLYMSLAKKDKDSNLFFSPLSVMTALGMTMAGSRSNTQQQLAKVLDLHHDMDAVSAAFSIVLSKYQEKVADYELRTANMMYASDKMAMQQQFTDTITGPFRATAKVVDFGGQTEAVRQEINQAVEKETNSKIKDLIPQGILNGLTRLVLINAVYFKGLWVETFDKNLTSDQSFYTSETSHVTVPMMHIKSKFQLMYRKDLGAKVLAMNYKGSNLSMVIVLPDSRTGLSGVEEKLAGCNLHELATQGHNEKVEVSLPRFKLEYSEDLVKTLSELGAPDLFTEGKCDLSGIGGEPGELFVSNVLHKAFLEVNEEGSEAAAATAAIAMTRALIRPTPPFIADHPFLFLLYDRQLQLTLFAGRYVQPDVRASKEEL